MSKKKNNIHTKKITNSKIQAYIAWVCFISVLICTIKQSSLGLDLSMMITALSVTGGLTGVIVVANLNKSKSENISKQRIRYVLMKLLLKDDLSPDKYDEICIEIDNIDQVFDNKLKSMLEDAVNSDAEIQNF